MSRPSARIDLTRSSIFRPESELFSQWMWKSPAIQPDVSTTRSIAIWRSAVSRAEILTVWRSIVYSGPRLATTS